MPRVETRTARKDYPQDGIKKGDTYYYTKLKLQRGGIVKRSLKPFKASQLTTSPFKGGFLAAGEAFEASDKSAEAMREAAEAIRSLAEEAQSSYDNLPEGFQMGDMGQMLENRVSECEGIADDLEDFAQQLDDLEEPTEPKAPEGGEPDDDEDPDFLAKTDAWETYQDELSEYEDAQQAYEDEIENIVSEAESRLGEMPD